VRVLEGLARGEVDLAMVGSSALPSHVALLAEIPDDVLLVAAREHPLAGRRVKPADLNGREFIQREPASDTRALVATWFQAQHVQVRTVMDVW
jgi:DNA-binding transcriptional LysR family regulator